MQRKLILATAFFALFASPSYAQFINPVTAKSAPYASAGTGQYALSVNSATSLTVPTGAYIAEICAESQAVRYRDDGSAPTASTGIPVASGTCFQYSGPLSAVQFIAQTSGATIDVSYYK